MKMFVSTADGGEQEPTPEVRNWIERVFGSAKGPRRLSEETILSLVTRGSNLYEVQALLNLAHEYKADWSAAQQIVYSADFGWQEMLQYRPGVLAAGVIKYQALAVEPGSPSFRQAACEAFGWPIQKVMGFQLGISNQLIENPTGNTDNHYLDGITLGYLFYNSQLAKKEMANGGNAL